MIRLRFAPALLLAVLIAGTARADVAVVTIGPANADGYVPLSSGLFQWSDGSLWSRAWVPGGGYYSGGCYYSTPGYFKYSYAGAYKAPVITVEKADDFGVLAKAVAARDAVQSRIRLNQQFVEAAGKLGFGPISGYGSYGGGVIIGTGSPLVGAFGVNTSTIYGYQNSLAQTIDPFRVNLDQYFLQAAQLAQGAQDSAKQAHSEFSNNVNLAADRAAQLSTIAARRDAVVAFAKLLDGPPVQSSSTYKFTVGPGGKLSAEPGSGTEQLPPPKARTLSERWNVSAQKCVACHHGQAGEKKDGGFALADFPALPADKKLNVLARLRLPEGDPKHMPKDAKPLSAEEFRDWVDAAFADQQPADKSPAMPKLK
jgi:hypothetical protein